MELKTKSDMLNSIAKRSENLVAELKEYIIDNGIRVGASAMDLSKADDFIKVIKMNLEGTAINGDENVLDDIIAIYNQAIKSIEEELEKNAELEDGNVDKFNDATIESFNNVKKALENSKGAKAEPLKNALDKLIEEKQNGKIVEEYTEIKVEEIEVEEKEINKEIDSNKEGLNQFAYQTQQERQALDEAVGLSKIYFRIKKELDEIDTELSNPDLSDEDKPKLEAKKSKKEEELVSVFKKMDEKYEKDDKYKQKDKESNKDYLARMEALDGRTTDEQVNYIVTIKQDGLRTKIQSLKGQKLKVFNEKTKQFEEVDFEKFIDLSKGKELNNLSRKINETRLLNNEGMKEQKARLEELNNKKESYKKDREEYRESNNQNLPVKANDDIGFWGKFGKRREYYQDKGDNKIKSFFKSFFGKKDEEIFENHNNRSLKEERKKLLQVLEVGVNKGERIEKVVRRIKATMFQDYDNADKNKKNDGPER